MPNRLSSIEPKTQMMECPQRLRVGHGELRQCGQPSIDEKGITNIS
jgi:hypothetical protein